MTAPECRVCGADHRAVYPSSACPLHDHALHLWQGKLVCPQCDYWRPVPADQDKPETVSDSQILALAASGRTGKRFTEMSYNDAAALLWAIWQRQTALAVPGGLGRRQ